MSAASSKRIRATKSRRGIALLTTLALLTLAAALLAGGYASATSAARGARSARASLIATAAARRALARALIEWSSAEQRLAFGSAVERTLASEGGAPLDASTARVRVQRVSTSMYLIAADVVVPAEGPTLARRRMRLLTQRASAVDTTIVVAPRVIARWALQELY